MPIFDKPTNAEAGVILLTIHSAAGQQPVGDFYVQLVDKTTRQTVDERRGALSKLPLALRTALQNESMPQAITTIRNAINTELAG